MREITCKLSRLRSAGDAETVLARLSVLVGEDTTVCELLGRLYVESTVFRRSFADCCRRSEQFELLSSEVGAGGVWGKLNTVPAIAALSPSIPTLIPQPQSDPALPQEDVETLGSALFSSGVLVHQPPTVRLSLPPPTHHTPSSTLSSRSGTHIPFVRASQRRIAISTAQSWSSPLPAQPPRATSWSSCRAVRTRLPAAAPSAHPSATRRGRLSLPAPIARLAPLLSLSPPPAFPHPSPPVPSPSRSRID